MDDKYLKINASVVVIPIVENKILLLKRQNTGWEDGKYTCPSGRMEISDTPQSAAIREVKEEIGVDISKEDLEFVHVDFVTDTVINFYFVVRKLNSEPKIMEPELCSELGWFDLNTLPKNLAANGGEVVQNILDKKYFNEYS